MSQFQLSGVAFDFDFALTPKVKTTNCSASTICSVTVHSRLKVKEIDSRCKLDQATIVELQQFSRARIQVSKKGAFSPGTR